MKEVTGDIWNWASQRPGWVVVTTNIGWSHSGCAVMGRGLALDCVRRYPGVDTWYGKACQLLRERTPVLAHPDHPLILFPTKALDSEKPHLSWKRKASLGLIERSLRQLDALVKDLAPVGPVYVPLVGCQNGGLTREAVLPLMRKHLTDFTFTLVLPGAECTSTK